MSLRSRKSITLKSIGLVEQHHHTCNGSCADDGTHEFEGLLFLWRSAEPITNLQVGDERACHGECCAYDTAHEQCRQHAGVTLQSYGHHHYRRKNQCHQRHSRHRIAADDGDGVGCYGSEEKGYGSHKDYGYRGVEKIEVHYSEEEESVGDEKGSYGAYGNDLERDVALGADNLLVAGSFAFHLTGSKPHGTLDDSPALDDADDSGHGYCSNAEATAIVGEDVLRTHGSHSGGDGGIPLIHDRIGEDTGH